ncbi:hypothetical protein J008_00331 [Cryptococcus neoformans]|nr:hypothetical protein C367_00328 [Cryptococcus neoformans var. grubii Ze90-1]OXH42023.1 hypothetical protein J008_00331 [Cryptococcus neoformans var. grubii]
MRYIILASIVSAALTITEPSAAHWWVAQSLNTLAWDGADPTEFSVFLANSDSNVLTSMLALASIVPTYQTSLTINPGDATPATGYTLLITNPLNSSDAYATSGSFEIKAVGSAYPPQGTQYPSIHPLILPRVLALRPARPLLLLPLQPHLLAQAHPARCEQSWQ